MADPTSTTHVDLVIIGAGPAGLMAAAWASQYPQVSTRIIERNAERVPTGHADGLVSRSLEILDSFNIVDFIYKLAYREIEMCSWTPDQNGRIQRGQRLLTSKKGISRFQGVEIHQGLIEQNYIDWLPTQQAKLQVERNIVTRKLDVADSIDEYPITLRVRHKARPSNHKSEVEVNGGYDANAALAKSGTNSTNGTNGMNSTNGTSDHHHEEDREEVIKAKYIIACDGAHSWTRQQVGLKLEGEQSDHIWGVIDIVPLTDFPDIRQSCAIHSAEHGSIITVPREGRLVRFYIQLNDLKAASQDERFDASNVKPETLMAAARKILYPYKMDYKICDWWSCYRIGQRVAPTFSYKDRVFLAGDACHTHSPSIGQGMNVSGMDAYNLAWKICSVAAGQSKPDILSTYQTERHPVACELISVDHQFAEFYSRKLDPEASNDDIRKDNQRFRNKFYDFMSGVAVQYEPSALVTASPKIGNESAAAVSKQRLASNIILGRRIPSYRIINQAEVRPIHLHDLLKSTGHWRLLVFAGDLSKTLQLQRYERLGERLSSKSSCLHKYAYRPNNNKDRVTTAPEPGEQHKVQASDNSLVQLFTIHSAKRTSINLLDLPEVFYGPWDEQLGWDYWKVYVDDESLHEGFEDAYGKLGVDRERGCLVVLRPDQHVSYVGELEDVGEVERFLEGCLMPSA